MMETNPTPRTWTLDVCQDCQHASLQSTTDEPCASCGRAGPREIVMVAEYMRFGKTREPLASE